MKAYQVTAKRWAHGWELHIEGVGVTQSRTLAGAEQMVRDYIATLYDLDEVTEEVVITPELGDLSERAARARRRVREAEEARRTAAREAREAVRAMRAEGISVSDTAKILGVSRGRVSELLKEKVSA